MNKLMHLNYKDIILKHGYGILDSRSKADITVNIGNKRYNSPVCISNMPSIQNYDILKTFDENHWFYVYHRFGNTLEFLQQINDENWYCKSISVGVKEKDIQLVKNIVDRNLQLDAITLDVAFCYAEHVKDMIKLLRKSFPNTYLIVGNASEPEVVPWLENLGAECLKFNIGVSSNCRTRQYSGFGSTTVTDLIKCIEKCDTLDICADGGLTVKNDEVWIGDVMKSIALGSKFVMSASLFKQIKELQDELGYITCSGNASSMIKQNEEHIEGVTLRIKGNDRTLLQQMKLISDSLRSSVSYSGWDTLDKARGRVNWEVVNEN